MKSLCHSLGLKLQAHQYANSFWNGVTPAQMIPSGEWCMSAEAKEIWQKFAEEFKNYG